MGAKGQKALERTVIEKADVNYREIAGAINQSMIKVYRDDPIDFYNQFILGKKKRDRDSFATLVGSLTEFILLECQCDIKEFESRVGEEYVIFSGTKNGGQAFLLADYLFEETEDDTDGNGYCKTEFIERFGRAFARVQAEDKFKGKSLEQALVEFEKKGKNGEDSAADYFEVKMSGIGKRVVDDVVVNTSMNVAKSLMEDEFTRDLFDINRADAFHQMFIKFPLEWTFKGMACKSEFDRMWLNEMDGEAGVDDLKVVYDNEGFDWSYIKNGYYIQNGFYIQALRWWLDNNGMKDFKIRTGMRFIVGDSSKNKRRPLIYNTTIDDTIKSMSGFKLRGYNYQGILELMDGINWSLENGIFNCSKENYEKKGNLNLTIPYE